MPSSRVRNTRLASNSKRGGARSCKGAGLPPTIGATRSRRAMKNALQRRATTASRGCGSNTTTATTQPVSAFALARAAAVAAAAAAAATAAAALLIQYSPGITFNKTTREVHILDTSGTSMVGTPEQIIINFKSKPNVKSIFGKESGTFYINQGKKDARPYYVDHLSISTGTLGNKVTLSTSASNPPDLVNGETTLIFTFKEGTANLTDIQNQISGATYKAIAIPVHVI